MTQAMCSKHSCLSERRQSSLCQGVHGVTRGALSSRSLVELARTKSARTQRIPSRFQLNATWRVSESIRCNGSCSGRRAIQGKRTAVGETDRSAERERDCCAAFVNIAARSIPTVWPKFRRSLTTTPIGSSQNDDAKLGRLRDVSGTGSKVRVSASINNLGNRGPEKQRSRRAAQLARYSVDIVTRKPLLCELGSMPRHLFLCIGPIASPTLLEPFHKRSVRRQ